MAVALKEKSVDSWYRELRDGRVEIMCCSPGFRIRVSAPAEEAWKAVEMFEGWTGLRVNSDRRPKRVGAPMPGQLTMTELQSEASDG
jgi:hypothetical protein